MDVTQKKELSGRHDQRRGLRQTTTSAVRMNPTIVVLPFLLLALLLYLYIRLNDAKLMKLPDEVASAFSPHRISARDALEAAAESETTSFDSRTFLPPRTGRRYIVVGGVCSISQERGGH